VIVEIIIRPTLSLTCPRCGAVFASAMQMDPKTFGGILIANMLECCPKCATVSRFAKSDYLFRSGD
jgi:ribosomal protein S27AE